MSSNCGECQKSLKKNDSYVIEYSCKHELNCCIDCINICEDEAMCFNCRSVKCAKCAKGVDKTKLTEYKRIAFQNCLTNDHSICICRSCFQDGYAKIVDTCDKPNEANKANKFCYLCTTNLTKNNLIHYNESLDCSQKHQIVICAKCHPIFKKIKKRCPLCQPFKIDSDFCFACYEPTSEKIAILPIACNTPDHKFTICIDCASNLSSPSVVCRFCDAKEKSQYFFSQTVETTLDELCVPVIQFSFNKIDFNAIEIDKFVCPKCHPVSATLKLIKSENSAHNHHGGHQFDDEEEETWFHPFSNVTSFGENLMVTGGVNRITNKSSKSCWVIQFVQDGRNFEYIKNRYSQGMNKRRHAHQSFYDQEEKTLYVIGGAQKINEKEILYLDSIECLNIIDETINFNSNENWNVLSIKLKKPRCSFSQCLVNKKLVLFGGFSGIGKMEESIEFLDLHSKDTELIQLNKGYLFTIYPIILKQSNDEIIVYGGFPKGSPQNDDAYCINLKSGNWSKSNKKGLKSSNKLHHIRAFDQEIIFGGNSFDCGISSNSARMKLIDSELFAPISEGYKNLKASSVEAMKDHFDCFGSAEFNFVFRNS